MLAIVNALRPVGLLLVRLVVGAVLMAHGYPKLFQSGPFLEAFPNMGFPAWTVYVAGTVEFVGGLLLVVGLFTRWAAFFISGQFAIAFLQVHWKLGERPWYGFLGKGGDEYALVLCVVALLLLTLGAGGLSLDRLVFKDKA
jgi:putative oxidoreductase